MLICKFLRYYVNIKSKLLIIKIISFKVLKLRNLFFIFYLTTIHANGVSYLYFFPSSLSIPNHIFIYSTLSHTFPNNPIHFFKYPSFWINNHHLKKNYKSLVTWLFLKRIPNRKRNTRPCPKKDFKDSNAPQTFFMLYCVMLK